MMYIKQLIKNKEQYWDFVWEFLSWADTNRSLWREEDLPKLQPFFDWQRVVSRTLEPLPWTEEVKQSFDFYQECLKSYGDRNAEVRNAVAKFSPEDILDAFGYKLPDYDDEDYEYSKDSPMLLDEDFDVAFPFVVTGEITCTWDRCGDFKILSVYFVSLQDFAEAA